MSAVRVDLVGPEAAASVHAVVTAAFEARERVDPPADALGETVASIGAALEAGGGLLAHADGVPVGALLLDPDPDGARVWLRRVGVVPQWQEHGVGVRLARAAIARLEGHELAVLARREFPAAQRFWQALGFVETAQIDPYVELVRAPALTCAAPDAEAMRELGRRLAAQLRAGDLLVLTGELGAGKTTFTQGLGEGLGVRGGITSPTFVIARVHPALGDGPDLVHVDAYRLGGGAELDDLDLDASLEESVTVVEWGAGLAEQLSASWLDVRIDRAVGADDPAAADSAADEPAADEPTADPRTLTLTGHGPRWARIEPLEA